MWLGVHSEIFLCQPNLSPVSHRWPLRPSRPYYLSMAKCPLTTVGSHLNQSIPTLATNKGKIPNAHSQICKYHALKSPCANILTFLQKFWRLLPLVHVHFSGSHWINLIRFSFPFGVWGRMWNLIVSVPDHCLFIYFLFGPGHAKKCLMPYANNKVADQSAHPRSLISTFVVRCLDSMICILAISKVLRF